METRRHPELEDLELSRTGEAPGEVRLHIETCAECRAKLGQLSALAGSLRISQPGNADISETADAKMLKHIEQRSREIRNTRHFIPFPVFLRYAAGIAATIVVVAAAAWMLFYGKAEKMPALAGDFNRDGSVDIIDAYLLARAAEQNKTPHEWDLNGDGRADRDDAVALAMRIVRIET